MLAGPRPLTTVIDRVSGFSGALADAGVSLSEKDIFVAAFTRDGGHEAMSELLSGRKKPTCVFAVTDVMANGALAAAREAGLSVPDDISLAGFDDIPIVRDLTPALTTVALPLEGIDAKAMELVVNGSRGTRSRIVRVTAEVMLRGSSARR